MNLGIVFLKRIGSCLWRRLQRLIELVRKKIVERLSGQRDQSNRGS